MMIQVVCRDQSRGFVEDSNLDDAVIMGIVVAFFRPGPNEWVDTKNGNVRKKADAAYTGPERRFSSKKNAPVHP